MQVSRNITAAIGPPSAGRSARMAIGAFASSGYRRGSASDIRRRRPLRKSEIHVGRAARRRDAMPMQQQEIPRRGADQQKVYDRSGANSGDDGRQVA